jgi:hypothetical protein
MMSARTVPGAEHYREIAGMLREVARLCQFIGARKEILHLAERFESPPTISIAGQDQQPQLARLEIKSIPARYREL